VSGCAVDIVGTVRKMRRSVMRSGFRFSRPLVLLQSDDWARVGVRDKEGFEHLRSAGLKLGERPYDLYSLETAEDVRAVAETLESVRDSVGQPACLEMNFVTTNVDFQASSAGKPDRVALKLLVEGLPGSWSRPGLHEAYREGIDNRVFAPALHGTTHFCQSAASDALVRDGERGELLRLLWKAETPYIHWRMPWIGYEYWNPDREPAQRFLAADEQQRWIAFAAESFQRFFGHRAVSACAPGYRANDATTCAWRGQGVLIAQNGPGAMRSPRFDDGGLLHTYRSIDLEPALNPEMGGDQCLASAERWFAAGIPFIISAHSINFHSTLAPFRQRTLPLLRHLLCSLTKNYPDMLFINCRQLFEIIETGGYESPHGRIPLSVTATATGAGV
jgi:hypothetical protein